MRGRIYLVYIGLTLAVVVLMNLPVAASMRLKSAVRDALTPFQNVYTLVVHSIRDSGSFLRGSMSFTREKERLIEENANLQLQLRLQKSIAEDNAELRRQIGFQRHHRYRLVLCEVVARGDATGWWETVRVNRGTSDGLAPNLAVMTSQGLVGKTTTVSRRTADVLLLTDPNCRIACKVEGLGCFGIVRGTGAALGAQRDLAMLYSVPASRMDYIHRDADIPDGTPVVTSELSGVYPEGLPVGRIASSSLDASRLFRRADVIPSADLGRLTYVFVVLPGIVAEKAEPDVPPEGGAAGAAPAAEEEASP